MTSEKMDYKELIEQLRKHHQSWAAYRDLELAHDLEDAITAIETLLAEREAAVEEIHGRCSKCKHFFSGILRTPCKYCCREGGAVDYWEWRGPTPHDRQKEDAHD